MAKPTAQQCHAMTTYFINKYTEVVGRSPSVNRNKARYGFEGLLMDYSRDEAHTLIDYYIEDYPDPRLDWFLYNYEKVIEDMKESEAEEQSRRKRREETQRRLEEWRNRWKS